MPQPTNPFRCFNSSPEVIRLVVMMYVKFPLSLRNVEDLLFERGIDVSYETVRFWWNRFGPMFAAEIRRKRARMLRARFDRIFTKKTGYILLDQLLARLHRRKDELLRVLDRPEIPLHTNGSENDIRCLVTKRKISGGTVSEAGKIARDVMLGLAKTCAKLDVSFWRLLGDRFNVAGAECVPSLPHLVRLAAT